PGSRATSSHPPLSTQKVEQHPLQRVARRDRKKAAVSLAAENAQLFLQRLPVLVINPQQIPGRRDVERLSVLTVDETNVAGELGVKLGGPQNLDGEHFQSGTEQHVQRPLKIAERQEIGEDDGDSPAAMPPEDRIDRLIDREVASSRDGLEEFEQ